MRKSHLLLYILFVVCSLVVWGAGRASPENMQENTDSQQVVNVYTNRHYDIDQKLFDAFTVETGITVNVISGSADELIERVDAEGKNADMDVLFLAEIGRLSRAKSRGFFAPIQNQEILNRVYPLYLDKDNEWIAVTMRPRVIVYDTKKGKPAIDTYEQLAEPNGPSVLVRSSSHPYNISLISFMIDLTSESSTENWVRGLVNNFGRNPESNDRDQIRAVVAGVGDVAIVNAYYINILMNSQDEKDREIGNRVGVIFPNPTHINMSGIGIGKYAKHRSEAEALIQYLLSQEAQTQLTDENAEYPVVSDVQPSTLLQSWGKVNLSSAVKDFNVYEQHAATATRIADENGWN